MPHNTDSIECRQCGCRRSKVTHTSIVEFTFGGKLLVRIRRRRLCEHCGLPFTTVETHEDETSLGNPESLPINAKRGPPLPSPEKTAAPRRLAAEQRNPYL